MTTTQEGDMVNGNGIFCLLGKMTLTQKERKSKALAAIVFSSQHLSWILLQASNLKSSLYFQLHFLLISNATFVLWISKLLFYPLDFKIQLSFTFCFPLRSFSSLHWQLKSVNTWKMVISLYIGFVKHWSKVYELF